MDLLSLQALLLFLIFVYIFQQIRNPKPKGRSGFTNYPLVGILPEFLKNRHRFLDWSTDVLLRCPTNTGAVWRPIKIRGIFTANPANVEHMLKTNFHNYPKGEKFIFLLRDFLGRGIFNSDGDLWKLQRRTASHEFSTNSLRLFIIETVSVEIHSRLAPILKKSSETETPLDLQDILERFAFDNVCKVAFNHDPACLGGGGASGKGDEFMRAFEEAANLSSGRFRYALPYLWRLKKFLNLGSERRLRESIRTVHEYADNIIRSKLQQQDDRNNHNLRVSELEDEDLLSRFIRIGRESSDSSESSADFLRDVVISFILAGRDTTSSALTWFFWLLSAHPSVEQSILLEIQDVRLRSKKKAGDSFSFEELREMNYLQAAISEAMRLYPPVPVDTKACLEDDIMPDGTFVGRGWFVMYSAYAMGRMEAVWGKDCREYRPERWLERGGEWRAESPYRFPVFHAGPRMCLGKEMAYIQMKAIAAAVMEGFVVEVLGKEREPEHLLSLTLRVKGGLQVMVHRRAYS